MYNLWNKIFFTCFRGSVTVKLYHDVEKSPFHMLCQNLTDSVRFIGRGFIGRG